MKYIIADPEEQNGRDLKKILDHYGMLYFKGNFTTLEEAEHNIFLEPPNIAFINMGKSELNAFKLANLIRDLNQFAKIVFISSQAEYALQAFECEADGFLLIPFEGKKIKNLMLRFFKKACT